MNKLSRDSSELPTLLREQILFLRNSAAAYDSGFEGECKRIALVIRVLLHDTSSFKSLLGQMGLKESLRFLDLSLPYDDRNLLSHSSLVRLCVGGSAGAKGAIPVPMFDEAPLPARQLEFDEWWNGIVFIDKGKTEFSRKDIVLFAANQDGGGHVDPKLDVDYANLTRNNSLGLIEVIHGKSVPIKDQVPASIRHIAFELLKTISPDDAVRCADPEGAGIVCIGMSVTKSTAPLPIPKKNRIKTGRNQPCPCGSGKKYKKCCLR